MHILLPLHLLVFTNNYSVNFYSNLQDEKNQIMTTNVWLVQVITLIIVHISQALFNLYLRSFLESLNSSCFFDLTYVQRCSFSKAMWQHDQSNQRKRVGFLTMFLPYRTFFHVLVPHHTYLRGLIGRTSFVDSQKLNKKRKVYKKKLNILFAGCFIRFKICESLLLWIFELYGAMQIILLTYLLIAYFISNLLFHQALW